MNNNNGLDGLKSWYVGLGGNAGTIDNLYNDNTRKGDIFRTEILPTYQNLAAQKAIGQNRAGTALNSIRNKLALTQNNAAASIAQRGLNGGMANQIINNINTSSAGSETNLAMNYVTSQLQLQSQENMLSDKINELQNS